MAYLTRSLHLGIAHGLPKAKLIKIGGLCVRFWTHREIATPERKTITQRVVLIAGEAP
jgi:hypothetical protein